jgi:hypothetical protein
MPLPESVHAASLDVSECAMVYSSEWRIGWASCNKKYRLIMYYLLCRLHWRLERYLSRYEDSKRTLCTQEASSCTNRLGVMQHHATPQCIT